MNQFYSNDRVKLVNELAELRLEKGTVGVVRHSWHFPVIAYEVEFKTAGESLRLLLLDHQVADEHPEAAALR